MPRKEAEENLECGKAHLTQNDAPLAIAYFQKAIEADPTYYSAYLFKAYGHFSNHCYTLAINTLKDLLSKRSSDQEGEKIINEGHHWIGHAYRQHDSSQKDHHYAAQAFKQALIFNVKDADLYYYLGKELLAINNALEAVAALEKAQKLKCMLPDLSQTLLCARKKAEMCKDTISKIDLLINYQCELKQKEEHLKDSFENDSLIKASLHKMPQGKAPFIDLTACLTEINESYDKVKGEADSQSKLERPIEKSRGDTSMALEKNSLVPSATIKKTGMSPQWIISKRFV